MKKAALIALSILAFACKQKATEKYQITGTITGYDKNETLYVNKINEGNKQVVIDSTQLIDGKFSIDLPSVTSKDFNFITIGKERNNILFIGENKLITIVADKSNLRGAKITGGSENAIFSEYLKNITEIRNLEGEINKQKTIAQRTGDYKRMKENKVRTDSIEKVKKEMRFSLIQNHPKSIVSIMALSDLAAYKMVDSALAKQLLAELDDSLLSSRLGVNAKKVVKSMFEETTEIGDTVANFSGPTPDGGTMNLKDSLGKYTILDFWASWCRPCRAENPNVVRVYKKYHKKGLEIISISMDKDANKWRRAIEQDDLDWKHVSHLKFWQEPIAKPFGVRSIPATFLLDEKGVIISKNLRGQALYDKIDELLGEGGA